LSLGALSTQAIPIELAQNQILGRGDPNRVLPRPHRETSTELLLLEGLAAQHVDIDLKATGKLDQVEHEMAPQCLMHRDGANVKVFLDPGDQRFGLDSIQLGQKSRSKVLRATPWRELATEPTIMYSTPI